MKIIKNRTSEIKWDPNGILQINLNNKADVDLEDIIDTFLTAKSLTNGAPSLVLIDTRLKRSITSKARKLLFKQNVPAKNIAKAVIVNSAANKNVHNLLFRFKNSRFPVKKFTSEAEARKWLRAGN